MNASDVAEPSSAPEPVRMTKFELAVSKLRELAAECAACDGTGVVTVTNYANTRVALTQEDCSDCSDIRQTIQECEAP